MTIATEGINDRQAFADIALVPGNTVNPDGRPSPRLRARLDAALALFRAKQCSFILVSGSVGTEGVDEATAMRAYLLAAGVPDDRIIVDSAGFNTEATAQNVARITRERKLNTVVAVSQFFHITRLRMLLERRGVTVVGNVHANYFEFRDAYSLAREVVAMLVLKLQGATA